MGWPLGLAGHQDTVVAFPQLWLPPLRCPNPHIPMECFRFQQNSVFLGKSLPSKGSLLPLLGQAVSHAQGPAW